MKYQCLTYVSPGRCWHAIMYKNDQNNKNDGTDGCINRLYEKHHYYTTNHPHKAGVPREILEGGSEKKNTNIIIKN